MFSIVSSKNFWRALHLLVMTVLVFGCADSERAATVAFRNDSSPAPAAAVVSPVRDSQETAGMRTEKIGMVGVDIPPAIARKIIYNAQIALVVEDIAKVDIQIVKLVKEAGGYISGSDNSGATNLQRTASWTIRIPVDGFEPFVERITRLGEVQKNHVESQDVTQEYVDVEARIGNKQKEETRLQKHLADSTGRLEDILTVERELTRVRGEIEQAQGRLRYLANLSSLSTVTLTASEVHDYKPPVRPTFAGRIQQTFEHSMESLVEFVQEIILFVVSIAPWIPVVLLLTLPTLWLLRIIRRRLNWAIRLEPIRSAYVPPREDPPAS